MTVPINSRELGGTATVIATIPTWMAATWKVHTPLWVTVLTGATGKIFVTLSNELRWKPNRCEDLNKKYSPIFEMWGLHDDIFESSYTQTWFISFFLSYLNLASSLRFK